MDAVHGKSARPQLSHLIFHQGNQRTNHQCGSAARQPRKLIAQALPRSGRHHQKNIPAIDNRLAHFLLVGAELPEAKGLMQQIVQIQSWLKGLGLDKRQSRVTGLRGYVVRTGAVSGPTVLRAGSIPQNTRSQSTHWSLASFPNHLRHIALNVF
jgi:hypothetical protein